MASGSSASSKEIEAKIKELLMLDCATASNNGGTASMKQNSNDTPVAKQNKKKKDQQEKGKQSPVKQLSSEGKSSAPSKSKKQQTNKNEKQNSLKFNKNEDGKLEQNEDYGKLSTNEKPKKQKKSNTASAASQQTPCGQKVSVSSSVRSEGQESTRGPRTVSVGSVGSQQSGTDQFMVPGATSASKKKNKKKKKKAKQKEKSAKNIETVLSNEQSMKETQSQKGKTNEEEEEVWDAISKDAQVFQLTRAAIKNASRAQTHGWKGEIEDIQMTSAKKKEIQANNALTSIRTLKLNSTVEELIELEKEFIFPLRKKSARFPNAKFFCRLCEYHCDTVAICEKHRKDTRHKRLKEIKSTDILLRSLPPPCAVHTKVLDSMIKTVYDKHAATDEQIELRKDAVQKLRAYVSKKLSPDVTLSLYGSSVSGFALKGSDVNIDLSVGHDKPAEELLTIYRLLRDLDQETAELVDVRSDFSAKVPTFLFKVRSSGLTCCLGVNNSFSQQTSKLLGAYSKIDIRVRQLGVAFRQWAKLCKIDKQAEGTLPAYAFNLMTVYFLQQCKPPLLPVLHEITTNTNGKMTAKVEKDGGGNTYFEDIDTLKEQWKSKNTSSVGELWVQLLRFYGVEFDMGNTVISIRRHHKLLREEKKWASKKLAIEDPFSRKRNIARSLSHGQVFEYIYDRLRAALKYYGIPQTQEGPLYRQVDPALVQKQLQSDLRRLAGLSSPSKAEDNELSEAAKPSTEETCKSSTKVGTKEEPPKSAVPEIPLDEKDGRDSVSKSEAKAEDIKYVVHAFGNLEINALEPTDKFALDVCSGIWTEAMENVTGHYRTEKDRETLKKVSTDHLGNVSRQAGRAGPVVQVDGGMSLSVKPNMDSATAETTTDATASESSVSIRTQSTDQTCHIPDRIPHAGGLPNHTNDTVQQIDSEKGSESTVKTTTPKTATDESKSLFQTHAKKSDGSGTKTGADNAYNVPSDRSQAVVQISNDLDKLKLDNDINVQEDSVGVSGQGTQESDSKLSQSCTVSSSANTNTVNTVAELRPEGNLTSNKSTDKSKCSEQTESGRDGDNQSEAALLEGNSIDNLESLDQIDETDTNNKDGERLGVENEEEKENEEEGSAEEEDEEDDPSTSESTNDELGHEAEDEDSGDDKSLEARQKKEMEDEDSSDDKASDSVHADLYDESLLGHLKLEDLIYKFDESTLCDGKGPAVMCSVCQKEGHLKQACPEEKLPELPPLPPLTQQHKDLLDKILIQVPSDFEPRKWEVQQREEIVQEVEDFIKDDPDGLYPDVKLQAFGSSCNGFGFQRSDLDICMTLSAPTAKSYNCVEIIENLAKILRKHRGLYNVFAITTAKVPIVKFKHRRSQVEGDISLYNTLALYNTRMLHMYSEIDYRVRVIGYTMKVFAKLCEIGDASRGSLSSYAYTLMVLYYLQQRKPPVIPVLQELHPGEKPERIIDSWNAWFWEGSLEHLSKVWGGWGRNQESVGELWIGLLRFYTEEFDYRDRVVCIRQQKILTRFEKLWNGSCIAIEDPFDLSHNLGAGISRKMNMYIIKAFRNGRWLFGNHVHVLPPQYKTWQDYFFDPDWLTEGEPPNDRGCKVCGKIGHYARDCPIVTARKERTERDKEWRRKQQQENKEDRQKDVDLRPQNSKGSAARNIPPRASHQYQRSNSLGHSPHRGSPGMTVYNSNFSPQRDGLGSQQYSVSASLSVPANTIIVGRGTFLRGPMPQQPFDHGPSPDRQGMYQHPGGRPQGPYPTAGQHYQFRGQQGQGKPRGQQHRGIPRQGGQHGHPAWQFDMPEPGRQHHGPMEYATPQAGVGPQVPMVQHSDPRMVSTKGSRNLTVTIPNEAYSEPSRGRTGGGRSPQRGADVSRSGGKRAPKQQLFTR